MSIWVLTYEINEYNQAGEYFSMAWDHKPSEEELKPHIIDWVYEPNSNPAKLLLETGGGRQSYEHTWYFLREIKD